MKKILLIAALAIGLTSCKKEEIKPEPAKIEYTVSCQGCLVQLQEKYIRVNYNKTMVDYNTDKLINVLISGYGNINLKVMIDGKNIFDETKQPQHTGKVLFTIKR